MTIINLQSSNGEIFPIDVEIAKCSITIKEMLDVMGEEEGSIVPLPKVNGTILRHVLEWAEKNISVDENKNDDDEGDNDVAAKRSRTEKGSNDDDDDDLLDLDQTTLFQLISAANYLEIRALTHVASKTVANMIKGKTPEELRLLFDIKNDFKPDEIA